MFTALHRLLGVGPGALTQELLDLAVDRGVAETDLDWKGAVPQARELAQSDFPKDAAAMANSGGGLIAFGVLETQKAATGRVDVGEVDETYERSLRSVAISAISPPVFGLGVHPLGAEGKRALLVEVPASVDGPHLIYRNHYFGAPVRNDADTVWMKEPQIEAMYRARFEERRHATEALDALFDDAAAGRATEQRAWLVGVGHPRIPRIRGRMDRAEARDVLSSGADLAPTFASTRGIHPLETMDRQNLRPGLRRQVAMSAARGERAAWKEARICIQDAGSVTLVAAVGGHRSDSDSYFDGWEVESEAVECAVADLMALIRAIADATDDGEYDVRVGIEWSGDESLMILGRESLGQRICPDPPLHAGRHDGRCPRASGRLPPPRPQSCPRLRQSGRHPGLSPDPSPGGRRSRPGSCRPRAARPGANGLTSPPSLGGCPDARSRWIRPGSRTPRRRGDRSSTAPRVRRQAGRLSAASRLHRRHLHDWHGRPFEPEAGDSLILAEAARATKTYAAVLHLAGGGFGPQGSMLVRSLFEGMAVAHWAHANPEEANELFRRHSRQGELLWGDAIEKVDETGRRGIDTGSTEERDELAALFGKYGARLWTGHDNLHALLVDIEDQRGFGVRPSQSLDLLRIVQRDNNQVLHSTALGLSAIVTGRSPGEIGLDAGRSSHYLDRALVGGTWSIGQTATLLWDHFQFPDRADFDDLFDSAWKTFLRPDLAGRLGSHKVIRSTQAAGCARSQSAAREPSEASSGSG